jgi:hypothetical protein
MYTQYCNSIRIDLVGLLECLLLFLHVSSYQAATLVKVSKLESQNLSIGAEPITNVLT